MNPIMVDEAIEYAARGIPVVRLHHPMQWRDGAPECSCWNRNCRSPAKHPSTAHGVKDATTDERTILGRWVSIFSNFNVGIATGVCSGMFVVDVDPKHGGDESLQRLEGRYGDLPGTPRVLTGGGGEHIYFRHPGGRVPCSQGKLGPGVDIKGDGGYVVAPPSLHIDGKRYTFRPGHHLDEVPLADSPPWLLARILPRGKRLGTPMSEWRELVKDGVSEGQRNTTIVRLAGYHLRHGIDPHVTFEMLLLWNRARCVPPLPDAEVEATVRSIARCEIARRRGHRA